MQDVVTGDVFVGFRTEDDADGRIVTLSALEFIVHPHVHIHLPDILVRNLGGL